MINEFISSWSLFENVYLAAWLIGILLSLVGVIVVARDQIFIGAAISQSSTLGIALAMWIGAHTGAGDASLFRAEHFVALMAVVFSVLAALVTARGGEEGRESHEAITGWVFLAAASLSILIVAHSPHGLEEIHRLLASSIIGASRTDVLVFGAIAAATALVLASTHRRIVLLSLDPPTAAAMGVKVRLWSAVIAVWLGLAVGLSIRSSGLLYTFGCLVLPALVAKNLCREVRPMFFVAPAIALGTGVIGFVLANYYDYPPAQMTVALLSATLALAWLARALRSS